MALILGQQLVTYIESSRDGCHLTGLIMLYNFSAVECAE
jgi:hypothetical protein